METIRIFLLMIQIFGGGCGIIMVIMKESIMIRMKGIRMVEEEGEGEATDIQAIIVLV